MARHLRTRSRALVGAALITTALVAPSAAWAYSGTLLSTNSGILGTGQWIVVGPTSISWDVNQNANGSWHYSYIFSHPEGATSHFVLEVSSSFTANDIFGVGGDFGSYQLGAWGPSPGNPNMPGSFYGIKFDGASGVVTHINFDAWRDPVWKDFYSKNGTAGGYGVNTAWNAGFTNPDSDPMVPASNGSVQNHILAPDSNGPPPPIPEPSTLLLLGSGLLGSVAVLRRRRQT